jgi:hypothetical protein
MTPLRRGQSARASPPFRLKIMFLMMAYAPRRSQLPTGCQLVSGRAALRSRFPR